MKFIVTLCILGLIALTSVIVQELGWNPAVILFAFIAYVLIGVAIALKFNIKVD